MQTGSSSKLFTLITALEQGIPFGFQLTVPGTDTVSGYYNCAGQPTGLFNVTNSEGPGTSTDSLYTGTTGSINVFFAHLEQQVGLCDTVKTAVNLGVTRVDGKSLLSGDGGQLPADDLPSFTLGVVNVSPMSMAAAYAVPASNGVYCKPIVLTKIVDDDGQSLPVPSAGCHQAISPEVAEAVNYILQGVLNFPNGTAYGNGLANYQAAGKTGTSNVANGNGTPFAAFAGYTTALAGYVSVFNPVSPTEDTMTGDSACYQGEYGGQNCPGEMFGANAPLSIWHMTFDHANLSGSQNFQPVPSGSTCGARAPARRSSSRRSQARAARAAGTTATAVTAAVTATGAGTAEAAVPAAARRRAGAANALISGTGKDSGRPHSLAWGRPLLFGRASRGPPRSLLLGLVDDGGVRRVGLHRLDAVEGCGLALVVLARRDHLAVAGLQVEVESALRTLLQHELAAHVQPPDSGCAPVGQPSGVIALTVPITDSRRHATHATPADLTRSAACGPRPRPCHLRRGPPPGA